MVVADFLRGKGPMSILQKLGRISANHEAASRARDFGEYCTVLMRAQGDPVIALRAADADGLSQRVKTVLKSAVAGSVTDLAGLTPYRVLAEGFSATLQNSAFDSVLGDANVVPLHSQFSLTVADATAASVGQGLAKRLTSISLGRGTVAARKVATLAVASEELLRFQSAAGLIEASLRAGLADATDALFLSTLISGTTPVAASGATASAFLHDLRILLDATGVTANSRFHLVVSPQTCARLATISEATTGALAFPTLTVNGGTISGIAVHASDALSTQAILLDAAQIAAGADAVEIRISQNASLEMDSAPTGAITPAPVASAQVSMYQTNSVAIACERQIGWSLLRANAVQSLSGVLWAT
jgi:hypothetical protein